MKKNICGCIFVILSIFHGNEFSLAATSETSSKLLKMSGFKDKGVTRIFFVFDTVPEFEMDSSGQRVRLSFSQTILDPTFKKPTNGEIIYRIEISSNSKKSIVDLYFRNRPKFVDVTPAKASPSLAVNIIWPQDGLTCRPAILDQRFGDFKATEGAAVGKKMISSPYSRRWIEFFKEFEQPVEFSLPMRFSLPPFPSALIKNYVEFLPKEFFQKNKENFWDRAKNILADLLNDEDKRGRWSLYRLILGECLIRSGAPGAALEVLERLEPEEASTAMNAWKDYFRIYSLASMDRLYQATNLFREKEKNIVEIQELAPWACMLQVELELAKKNPEHALNLLNSGMDSGEASLRIGALRKADALYDLDQLEQAFQLYQNDSSNYPFWKLHPYSLARWADILYQKKEYIEAYRYYSLLSEVLSAGNQEHKALSDFRAAAAALRSEDLTRARTMFSNISEKHRFAEAGFRSWLKLKDLSILDEVKPDLEEILSDFDNFISGESERSLREEAFFKKIVILHLYGEDLRAIKLLGRFFEDYWAGKLLSEAQALFVEIFPKVVDGLIRADDSFYALALVRKHRKLLAQACITDDFLLNLARHYHNVGLLDQAEETYLFLLDFEKGKEKRRKVYLPLIQICHEQKKYDRCEKYASIYLKEYPEGNEKANVLHYYADILAKKGDIRAAAALLLKKDRPVTKELDELAGSLFLNLGQYELVEYYLSRAQKGGSAEPGIAMKRAEAFFLSQKLQKAVPLFESMLENPEVGGKAGYRLIQIFFQMGQKQRALKLFDRLTEMEIEKQWLELAREAVQTAKYL